MSHIARAALLAVVLAAAAPHAWAGQVYTALLSGVAEAPPNASPGTGTATVTLDATAHLMKVDVAFSGLAGPVSASHIHAATAVPGVGTASVATPTPSFPGFPSGVTSGTYSSLFDMTLASSYRAGYITANGGTTASAEAALFGSIAAGTAYLNIHTSLFPGGEIRGFFTPVPEPTFLAFGACLGMLGLTVARRRIATASATP